MDGSHFHQANTQRIPVICTSGPRKLSCRLFGHTDLHFAISTLWKHSSSQGSGYPVMCIRYPKSFRIPNSNQNHSRFHQGIPSTCLFLYLVNVRIVGVQKIICDSLMLLREALKDILLPISNRSHLFLLVDFHSIFSLVLKEMEEKCWKICLLMVVS